MTGDDANAYAKEWSRPRSTAREAAVVRKVTDDLAAKGAASTRPVRAKMTSGGVAAAQVKAGGAKRRRVANGPRSDSLLAARHIAHSSLNPYSGTLPLAP